MRRNILKSALCILVVSLLLTLVSFTVLALPTHVLTGYWQNFNNGATCLRLSQVPTTYDIIAVAFADATGTPGAVDFTLDSGLSSALGGYTKAQFIADIATVKGRGQTVIISVGGQNGTVSVASSTAATNFANSIVSLMDEYGFQGVDIDLENGLNPQYMAQALQSIASQKPGVIITMAPETLYMQSPSSTYLDCALRVKNILTVVNTQYYNSGAMLGYDGKVYSQGTVDFLTALATIPLENGLAPSQVGLGLPASPSGAGSGYVAPSVVNAALDCLAYGTNCGSFRPPRTYPSIRGVMDWSINWDASAGYNFANTVKPKLNSLPSGGDPTPTNTSTPTQGVPSPTPTPTTSPASGIVLSINGNVLTWTDSASGNDYHVYKNGGWIAWTSNRTYTISGAVTGDAFYVTNGSGSVKSNTVIYGGVNPTPTNTNTPTIVATPTNTNTPTIVATPTNTNTPTVVATPTNTPTASGGAAPWAPNTYYAVNAQVTYGGHTYKCIQAHTSLVGWEPPNVPALWQLVN